MSAPQLKLLRVLTRGPAQPNSVQVFGGVEYRRETAPDTAIYMSLHLPSRRGRLTHPDRNDEHMKITVLKLPLSKSVGVEFCGTSIDEIAATVGTATTDAGAVLALKPILDYLQKNFQVA